MERTHFQFRGQEIEEAEATTDTPSNAGLVRFPKSRLLDRILKSEACATSGIVNSRSPSSALAAGTALNHHPPLFHKRISAEDRFISSRSKYSLEAANYLLTKQPAKVVENYELDVLKEVEMLHVKWRKELMHSAMVKENVIPGLGQKKVLRQSLLPITQSKEMSMEDYYKEGTWRSRPRKRPSITSAGTVLDMPHIGRPTLSTRNRIDWSSKNIFAEALHEKLTVFNVTLPHLAKEITNHSSERICALKWNYAGDQLIICTFLSEIKLYNMEINKLLWVNLCYTVDGSTSTHNYVRCLCWSPDDKCIALGCEQMITVYRARTARAVSTDKAVRIFTWPALLPVFDIVYNYPANGLAWHPMNGNMLCIGGGLSDASLSIWDMTTKDVISYRLVDFFGSINQLAWNKISGELVVQWTCIDEENEIAIMPVMSSLDRVVDEIPLTKALQVHALMWNADHSQLAVYNEECLSIWNFFGDEYEYRQTCKKHHKKSTRRTNFSSIHHTIR